MINGWRFRAVVFDLDGTLVDSAPDLTAALNCTLAEVGRPPLTLDAVIGMIGDGAVKLVARAWTATGGIGENDDLGALTTRFLSHYEGSTSTQTKPYTGVAKTLAELAGGGLRLGVCTNKPEAPAKTVLTELALAHHFDVIVGGDSLGNIRKPDPRHLLAVLYQLGVGADAAVMVGDNANDVAVGRATGVPVVVRAGGYTTESPYELGADAVFERYSELIAVLDRLQASSVRPS